MCQFLTTRITVSIDWENAVEAVCEIVASTPHLSPERLEKAAKTIRDALNRPVAPVQLRQSMGDNPYKSP